MGILKELRSSLNFIKKEHPERYLYRKDYMDTQHSLEHIEKLLKELTSMLPENCKLENDIIKMSIDNEIFQLEFVGSNELKFNVNNNYRTNVYIYTNEDVLAAIQDIYVANKIIKTMNEVDVVNKHSLTYNRHISYEIDKVIVAFDWSNNIRIKDSDINSPNLTINFSISKSCDAKELQMIYINTQHLIKAFDTKASFLNKELMNKLITEFKLYQEKLIKEIDLKSYLSTFGKPSDVFMVDGVAESLIKEKMGDVALKLAPDWESLTNAENLQVKYDGLTKHYNEVLDDMEFVKENFIKLGSQYGDLAKQIIKKKKRYEELKDEMTVIYNKMELLYTKTNPIWRGVEHLKEIVTATEVQK